MTRNITKKDKIRILINENAKLEEENKKYRMVSDKSLTDHMVMQMNSYMQINKQLHKKYIELDKLRFVGLMNRWKYQWMFMWFKVKKILAL